MVGLHLALTCAETMQLKDETERCEEDEAEKRVKLKAMREHHHKWEDTREGRVGTWRDFVKGKKTRVSSLLPHTWHSIVPMRQSFVLCCMLHQQD